MDILKTHGFMSFVIACMYFIVKSLMNRFNTNKEEYETTRKSLFKDSILLFILSYLLFVAREQLIQYQQAKTEVFTNEPSF